MGQVSGGGLNSDMQQSIRRAEGDPNNQRDPVEKVLPWAALWLAVIVVVVLVFFSGP